MKYSFRLLLTLTLTACSSQSSAPTSSLSKFKSCDEISAYLKNSLEAQVDLANSQTSRVQANGSPAPTASAEAAPTDTREGGALEEGDSTKIDGGILAARKGSSVEIYDLGNLNAMQRTASIQVPDQTQVSEIILKNKILIVVASDGMNTKIISYDLEDLKNPKQLKEFELSSTYVQARISASEDRALLVVNSGQVNVSSNIVWSAPAQAFSINSVDLPTLTTQLIGEKREAAASAPLCDCQKISHLPNAIDATGTTMTHIVSISLDRKAELKQELSFLGSAPVIRATSDAFLFAIPFAETADKGTGLSTHLLLAKDISGNLEAQAETQTDGFLKEQFNLNVAGDFVYAFTSLIQKSDYAFSEFVPAETVLKTFHIEGNSLRLVNTSKGIGQNEFLFSSLFTDKRAYAVTFKKTDPFYVFDFSSAMEPKILGELKIDGYSRQIRDISESQVLAIGRAAEDQGDFALYQGVQVSLFDIDTSGKPSLKDRKIFGDRATRSDAAGNGYWSVGDQSYKSYIFDRQNSVLLLPTSFNGSNGSWNTENTIQIFKTSDHLEQQPQIKGFESYVDRVVEMPNNYLAISETEIASLSKDAPIRVLQKIRR